MRIWVAAAAALWVTEAASAPRADVRPSSPNAVPAALYVATDGDDASPGTRERPWRTIQKAMSAAPPGSTVHIMAGTYPQRLRLEVSGTPGAPITFQPFRYAGPRTGDEVLLDYRSLGVVTDGVPFLRISSRAHVTIRGLRFQNFVCSGGMQQGVRIDGASHDIALVDNRFLHSGPTDGRWGTDAFLHLYIWAPAHHVRIEGNEFGWIHSVNSEALTAWRASDVVIADNTFHDGDTIAIDIFRGAADCIVRGNRIEYWGRKRSDGSFWYGVSSPNIYVTGAVRTLVERNVIGHSTVGVEVQPEPTEGITRDVTVRDNVIYACDQGIEVGVNPGYGTDRTRVQDVAVINNTVYGCDYGAVLGYAQNVTWRNNAIVRSARNGVYAYASGLTGHTFDRNLLHANAPSVWRGVAHTNDLERDPGFRDPAHGDFVLRSDSPAVDAGDPGTTAKEAGALDGAGRPRIVNGRIDLGAYERHPAHDQAR